MSKGEILLGLGATTWNCPMCTYKRKYDGGQVFNRARAMRIYESRLPYGRRGIPHSEQFKETQPESTINASIQMEHQMERISARSIQDGLTWKSQQCVKSFQTVKK